MEVMCKAPLVTTTLIVLAVVLASSILVAAPPLRVVVIAQKTRQCLANLTLNAKIFQNAIRGRPVMIAARMEVVPQQSPGLHSFVGICLMTT
jgi:hypothetical protein